MGEVTIFFNFLNFYFIIFKLSIPHEGIVQI